MRTKYAVHVLFDDTVKVCEGVFTVVVPFDQYENSHPSFAVAVIVQDSPFEYVPSPYVYPADCGDAEVATVYFVVATGAKTAVRVCGDHVTLLEPVTYGSPSKVFSHWLEQEDDMPMLLALSYPSLCPNPSHVGGAFMSPFHSAASAEVYPSGLVVVFIDFLI